MDSVTVAVTRRERVVRAACAYAEQFGWAVFPVAPLDKVPLLKGGRGFRDATTDPGQIRSWWRSWPDANIGLACGDMSGGVFAVDVDPRNGGDWSWSDLCAGREMPQTPVSLTGGGGYHVLFRGDVGCSVIEPGVDIKGTGGYIVLPPSVHPSHRPYIWEASSRPDDLAVADVPGWLLERCRKAGRRNFFQHVDSVNPKSFVLGAAFDAAGWLGPEIRPGVFAAQCPNENEHSCGERFDSSTVIFAPSPGNNRGYFHCSHEHCRGRLR